MLSLFLTDLQLIFFHNTSCAHTHTHTHTHTIYIYIVCVGGVCVWGGLYFFLNVSSLRMNRFTGLNYKKSLERRFAKFNFLLIILVQKSQSYFIKIAIYWYYLINSFILLILFSLKIRTLQLRILNHPRNRDNYVLPSRPGLWGSNWSKCKPLKSWFSWKASFIYV